MSEPKKSQKIRSFQKSHENGAPEEIRTPDPQIRSLVLYPAELRARWYRGNVEPITRLAARAIAKAVAKPAL
jgi:hypothetical protein